MPANPASAADKAIISQLLGDDPALRALASKLVKSSLAHMVQIMENGSPADKAAIARSLSGVITRAITEPTEVQESHLQTEMRQMMLEWRGEWAPHMIEEDIPVDAPPMPESESAGPAVGVQEDEAPVPRTKGRVA